MKDGQCRRETRLSALITSAVVTAIFCGCITGPDDVIVLPPVDAYYTKVAEGWLEFESGHYGNAITAFSEASEIDPMLSEAYLGLGWCYAMLDQMEDSLSTFDLAITREPESPHGYAAEAFVYLARSEYEAAIEAANKAISLGGEGYVFGQLPDVRTRNLRLLMAESYYATGQYEDSRRQVDILRPDNSLDQDSGAYKQELLLEIEDFGPIMPVLDEITD